MTSERNGISENRIFYHAGEESAMKTFYSNILFLLSTVTSSEMAIRTDRGSWQNYDHSIELITHYFTL